MDDMTQAASKLLDNGGVIGIVALLIFRLPAIIREFNAGVQYVLGQLQAVQNRAHDTFKESLMKMLEDNRRHDDKTDERLAKIEDTLNQVGRTLDKVSDVIVDLNRKG